MDKIKVSLKDDVVITLENVQVLGEKIAVCAVKNARRFASGSLDNIYHGLINNILSNKGVNFQFSDGYDVAQECICFLCNYFGHKLGEMCCTNLHKKQENIRMACYKIAYVYLRKQKRNIYRERELNEAITVIADPNMLKSEEDYRMANCIIRKLNLSVKERDVLKCLYNEMKYQDIADYLQVTKNTIGNRKNKIIKKYTQCFK